MHAAQCYISVIFCPNYASSILFRISRKITLNNQVKIFPVQILGFAKISSKQNTVHTTFDHFLSNECLDLKIYKKKSLALSRNAARNFSEKCFLYLQNLGLE